MGVDEESFLEKLQTLNIDTGDVSFAWLLEEDNEILNWFFKNVNSNNCLTPEDKAKFSKLEESGEVLNEEELKSELEDISRKYPEIALPDEAYGLCDAKGKADDLQEWIHLMQSQERAKTKMIDKNETLNRELSKKQFELNERLSIENSVLAKVTEELEELVLKARDEKLQCYGLLEEVLKMCADSKNSSEKLFFSQYPLEEYSAKTEMLVTYLRCGLSRQLEYFCSADRPSCGDSPSAFGSARNRDARLAEAKLKETCERLKEGLFFYVKSKSELDGLDQQLKFLREFDFDSSHDSHFEKVKMAGMVKLLEAEVETFQAEKLPESIQQFVDRQSDQVIMSEIQLRYEKAKYIYEKFCSLVSVSQEALNETNVALMCLRRDQLSVENLLQFSIDTINCLQSENTAKKSRQMIHRPVNTMSFLLKSLYGYFQMSEQLPIGDLCRTIERLQIEIGDLENGVFYEKFSNALVNIDQSKAAAMPMRRLIWDGATDQPGIRNHTLDSALYEVQKGHGQGECKIKQVTKTYMEFKELSEKDCVIYDLWKWFLADSTKIRIMREEYNSREHRPTKPFK